jgi:hypothetical protein
MRAKATPSSIFPDGFNKFVEGNQLGHVCQTSVGLNYDLGLASDWYQYFSPVVSVSRAATAIQSQRDVPMSAQANGLGNATTHHPSPNGAAITFILIQHCRSRQRGIVPENRARIDHHSQGRPVGTIHISARKNPGRWPGFFRDSSAWYLLRIHGTCCAFRTCCAFMRLEILIQTP